MWPIVIWAIGVRNPNTFLSIKSISNTKRLPNKQVTDLELGHDLPHNHLKIVFLENYVSSNSLSVLVT